MQFNFFFACGALFSVLLLHSSFPFVRLFRSYFVPLFLSSDFSVPLLFLFSALQTFPFLFVPLFRSSDFSARISFLFSVLLSARHFLDGGVFRSIGNFLNFSFLFLIFLLSFFFEIEGSHLSKKVRETISVPGKGMPSLFVFMAPSYDETTVFKTCEFNDLFCNVSVVF